MENTQRNTLLEKPVLNKNEIDAVFYHGSCADGFGSAFVAWHYFKHNINASLLAERSEMSASEMSASEMSASELSASETSGAPFSGAPFFVPCYFLKEKEMLSDAFIKEMTGKNILMCDFSYKYEQLVQLINVTKSFMILDHHKTSQADLERIPESMKIFDMNRSGAGITWDYFYPDMPIPKFLAHIQDRDIWTYKIPKTHEFIAYFYEQEFNFDLWETYLDEVTVQQAIEKGTAWLEYQKVLTDKIIRKTSYVIQEINNQYCVVLYCNSSELKSDIGNQVFHKYPFGDFSVIWDYDLYKNQTTCSLRSTDERIDVSAIAKIYGGGGHRNASGVSFEGMVPCLPEPPRRKDDPRLPSFRRIEDPGVLSLLFNCTKGSIQMSNSECKYTLFKVKELRSEWIREDYLDLIKKKTSDSQLIVFEKPSEIISLKEYNVIYNEKAIKTAERQLPFMVCGSKDQVLTFTSNKDFSQMFDQLLHDRTKNYSDSDSDSDDLSD